jgi:hypothetical protein
MAFSLLEHALNNKKTQLKLLLADLTVEQQQETVAFVLGRLIKLEQQSPEDTYQAILNLSTAYFWHDIDQQLILSAISQQTGVAEQSIKAILEKVFVLIASEIKQLDEAASLEQAGVSELIQGQMDYLQGQAGDWLWDLIQFTELKGQQQAVTNAPDLNKSIADLSSMIQHAHQAQKPATQDSDSGAVKNTKSQKIGFVIIILAIALISVLLMNT